MNDILKTIDEQKVLFDKGRKLYSFNDIAAMGTG